MVAIESVRPTQPKKFTTWPFARKWVGPCLGVFRPAWKCLLHRGVAFEFTFLLCRAQQNLFLHLVIQQPFIRCLLYEIQRANDTAFPLWRQTIQPAVYQGSVRNADKTTTTTTLFAARPCFTAHTSRLSWDHGAAYGVHITLQAS